MANAGRDPLFFATLAIAEQEFDGVGDSACAAMFRLAGWRDGPFPQIVPGSVRGKEMGWNVTIVIKWCAPTTRNISVCKMRRFWRMTSKLPSQATLAAGWAYCGGGSDKLGPYDDVQAHHNLPTELQAGRALKAGYESALVAGNGILEDLEETNVRIYEAHYGIITEWAQMLIEYGVAPELLISFDRVTEEITHALTDVAAVESFHFALNNTVMCDNRIPPYGMLYSEAQRRNALPVPSTQYGTPGMLGIFNHFDEVPLRALRSA